MLTPGHNIGLKFMNLANSRAVSNVCCIHVVTSLWILLVLFLSSLLIRSFSKYFSERFCFAVLLDVSLVEEKCEEKEAFNDLMFKFQSFSVPLSLCCDFYHHFLAFESHLWYLKPQRGRRMINAFLLLE